MRLSQVLSNFSKGEADILRKAMKKDFSLLQKLKPQFIDGVSQMDIIKKF